MRGLVFFASIVAAVLLFEVPAEARRFALVIGNGDYGFAPLNNPGRDARLVADRLSALDFEVIVASDLTAATLEETLALTRERITGADVFFLYYAGHALQYRGDNRLLMTDVAETSVEHVLDRSVSVTTLIARIAEFAPKVFVFVLDACRDNPIADAAKDFQTGLSYVESSPQEMLVAYATSAGQVAFDGAGANGPYAIALANALAQPNVALSGVFRDVRRRVREATGGSQIPWVSSSVEREVVLREAAPVAAPAPEAADGDWTEGVAEIVWAYVKDAGDPRSLQVYQNSFPQSAYASVARSMLQQAALTRRVKILQPGESEMSVALEVNNTPLPTPAGEFGTTVDRYPLAEMRYWPDRLPDLGDGLSSLVDDCDLLAGDPDDPAGVALGVHMSLVSASDAIPACAFAAVGNPGVPRYLFLLGRALELGGYIDWAIRLYTLAGERGYSQALVNLGHLYRFGVKVPADYRRAFGYYRRAALIGNPQARMGISIHYDKGWGVPQSTEESILWARLAGSQGWTNAYDMLGNRYRKGEGVEKDPEAAFRLYLYAAQMGQTNAMNNLGLAYMRGEGVGKDERLGLEWLNKAHSAGNRYAAFQLAKLAQPDNPERAERYYIISAERDFPDARIELAKMYRDQQRNDEAYFQLLLARRLGYERPIEELTAPLERALSPAEQEEVGERVEQWLNDNGF